MTEVGASIGHLATIARELRIPAIFGAAGAMERLPEGTEVTVDAGDKTVYRGIVEPLLASRDCSTELYPNDPEYVTLRRLLRWIMPLDLIDPDSSSIFRSTIAVLITTLFISLMRDPSRSFSRFRTTARTEKPLCPQA